jgi:general secretion pathway protein G
MEIVVVVTIIALLAALVAPRIMGQLGSARTNIAKSEASSIAQAISLYITDSGSALNDDVELEVLLLPPDDGGGPNGPYLNKKEDLEDPWGNAYVIIIPGEVNYDYDIISAGEDGEIGTEDDITN